MTPQHLSRTEFAGLLRVGDVLIPGDQAFPSFSASKCGAHADRMLMYMTESDRRGLKILLRVFRFAPRFAVRGILYLTESHGVFPQPIAAALRLTGLGAKGLVMTLYYSDLDGSGKIHNLLKWDAEVDDRARSSDHPEAPPPQRSGTARVHRSDCIHTARRAAFRTCAPRCVIPSPSHRRGAPPLLR